jgi:hypothetical protein
MESTSATMPASIQYRLNDNDETSRLPGIQESFIVSTSMIPIRHKKQRIDKAALAVNRLHTKRCFAA